MESNTSQTSDLIPLRPIVSSFIPQRPITPQITLPARQLPPPKPPELTRKQKLFVEYKLQGMNDSRAALKAGYKQTVADNAGEVRAHPLVRRELRRRLNETYKDNEIETDDIINGWRRIHDANILDYVDVEDDGSYKVNLKNVTREQADVIEELSVDAFGRTKVKLAAKQPAREMLARHKKLFTDSEAARSSDQFTISKLDELVRNYSAKKITVNQHITNNTFNEASTSQESSQPAIIEVLQQ